MPIELRSSGGKFISRSTMDDLFQQALHYIEAIRASPECMTSNPTCITHHQINAMKQSYKEGRDAAVKTLWREITKHPP